MSENGELFDNLRPLLFSIAYRMLGSVTEAEDIVQESFVRYEGALSSRRGPIESPKAYLTAIATRLSLNHLRSARTRREVYIGDWLPEPLLTDETALDGARYVEESDTLSMSFLLVLERLKPVERAVFLLHDVFDFGYPEVAEIVGKTEANCRQLAARARQHITVERTRFEPSEHRREQLAERFFDAVSGRGDIQDLVDLLAADVVAYSDGGGKVPAARRAVYGRERVAQVLTYFAGAAQQLDVRMERTHVNGQPGALFLDDGGRVISVMLLDVADDQIQAVRSIVNPDKLVHVGPTADVREIVRRLADRSDRE
jgi:RNA polymerase sigma-70 factor (ECF subfamily)